MIFSKIYQFGDIIAKVVNTSSGVVEIVVRITRINGVIIAVQDTLADATTVKPLVGREYLNTLKTGISGKTITWMNGFDPNTDISKVATSTDAALAYGISLGVSQSGGVTITTSNYTVLRTSVISPSYLEDQLVSANLINNPEVLSLIVIVKVYEKVLAENGLLAVANNRLNKAKQAT
ncbi:MULTISPECIES: hypothetical protein [unclassified Arcicella]|uniref:hypothetical protein n=1 Tax=unclassified Arcicella TaxID=2644986 RepID=UPI00285684AD|nr:MULTISPECIES: hypothetical protein [unclassified Arcicella]MDR6564949.1 hypothetical protein [Arcicella sp. BE51]MDR6814739.1 hypothetical protein [Arcicella sp. BE140]MDR6826185.1 hypothetical protein [Arcicella sp. BE139]